MGDLPVYASSGAHLAPKSTSSLEVRTPGRETVSHWARQHRKLGTKSPPALENVERPPQDLYCLVAATHSGGPISPSGSHHTNGMMCQF